MKRKDRMYLWLTKRHLKQEGRSGWWRDDELAMSFGRYIWRVSIRQGGWGFALGAIAGLVIGLLATL